ncbi:SMAD/FHA domain [Pseudocohnilembus persalinus]|uniref:SMAD/FHA domain n=1 Tax=Pseudocohnilembus persalinus TaxID=266149 RepID=A0A0V0QFP2_PSEPJ|nr:SMAD/FHA domain [Pseudocohnilembus persalinus]|eukprot:KRX00999.1 SMAD/FHA domain [Pseudocohnilembus persalinus]
MNQIVQSFAKKKVNGLELLTTIKNFSMKQIQDKFNIDNYVQLKQLQILVQLMLDFSEYLKKPEIYFQQADKQSDKNHRRTSEIQKLQINYRQQRIKQQCIRVSFQLIAKIYQFQKENNLGYVLTWKPNDIYNLFSALNKQNQEKYIIIKKLHINALTSILIIANLQVKQVQLLYAVSFIEIDLIWRISSTLLAYKEWYENDQNILNFSNDINKYQNQMEIEENKDAKLILKEFQPELKGYQSPITSQNSKCHYFSNKQKDSNLQNSNNQKSQNTGSKTQSNIYLDSRIIPEQQSPIKSPSVQTQRSKKFMQDENFDENFFDIPQSEQYQEDMLGSTNRFLRENHFLQEKLTGSQLLQQVTLKAKSAMEQNQQQFENVSRIRERDHKKENNRPAIFEEMGRQKQRQSQSAVMEIESGSIENKKKNGDEKQIQNQNSEQKKPEKIEEEEEQNEQLGNSVYFDDNNNAIENQNQNQIKPDENQNQKKQNDDLGTSEIIDNNQYNNDNKDLGMSEIIDNNNNQNKQNIKNNNNKDLGTSEIIEEQQLQQNQNNNNLGESEIIMDNNNNHQNQNKNTDLGNSEIILDNNDHQAQKQQQLGHSQVLGSSEIMEPQQNNNNNQNLGTSQVLQQNGSVLLNEQNQNGSILLNTQNEQQNGSILIEEQQQQNGSVLIEQPKQSKKNEKNNNNDPMDTNQDNIYFINQSAIRNDSVLRKQKAYDQYREKIQLLMDETLDLPFNPFDFKNVNSMRIKIKGVDKAYNKDKIIYMDGARIGRHPDNSIKFEKENYISKHHARIIFENDQFFIQDLGSTQGTFIKIQEQMELKQKMHIQFGYLVEIQVDSFKNDGKIGYIKIIVKEKEGTWNKEIEIPEGKQIKFGRGEKCQVQIKDQQQMISNQHSFITYEDGKFYIHDNNSLNGTWLRLSPEKQQSDLYPLKQGSKLRIFHLIHIDIVSVKIMDWALQLNEQTQQKFNDTAFN